MPWWFDRAVWHVVPAHRDRHPALRADLERLGRIAERESRAVPPRPDEPTLAS